MRHQYVINTLRILMHVYCTKHMGLADNANAPTHCQKVALGTEVSKLS